MKSMITNNSDKTIERIISLMQADNSVDAPRDAVRWSKNIFRTRIAESKPSLVQKIFAVLQLDLSPDKAAFGERSASAKAARQMLFEAGDNSIDLRISEHNGKLKIQGQILGDGFSNAEIKLGSFETMTNDISEFKFDSVPKQEYRLQIKGADREIEIERLNLD